MEKSVRYQTMKFMEQIEQFKYQTRHLSVEPSQNGLGGQFEPENPQTQDDRPVFLISV